MNTSRVASAVVALMLAAVGSAAGCAERRPTSANEPAAVEAPVALQQGQAAPGAPLPAERAMRITIETSITVTDVERAARALRELTAQYGGYVGEARSGGNEAARSAWFELHIPVARLVAFRTGVAALGEVASDSEKAEDVTEQRADIRARLGNARAEEKRMLELLDKRAGTLADIVAVEKELASVRETIERMEAQERVLEGQIASATIRVHLATRHPEARLSPSRRIARAAGDGVNAAGEFLVGAAVVGVAAAPTLLILAAIGFVVFRFVRFVHRRTNKL